ncbi:MAG: hypothetical protein ACP5PZ_06030 [Bacteroidales bacterium]
MKTLLENLPVTVTSQWHKNFPDFMPESQPSQAEPARVVMCTATDIANEISNRIDAATVYLVHSDHPWIDVRYVAELYLMPYWEPANDEEFYLMLQVALVVTEKHNISIIVHIPKDFKFQQPTNISAAQAFIGHYTENIPLPENYLSLSPIDRIRALETFSAHSPFNTLVHGSDRTLGIIACGSIGNILEQIPQLPYPILKLKHYPLGRELAESIYYPCDEILVLEQGLPYIEQRLRGIMGVGTRIRGKLNRIVPADEPISLQVITNILNL